MKSLIITISLYENKKAFSPFYHKKFFDKKWIKSPIGFLQD